MYDLDPHYCAFYLSSCVPGKFELYFYNKCTIYKLLLLGRMYSPVGFQFHLVGT
jgi:hypothetical protein